MHTQFESEGYADVIDVIVKWLHGRKVNTPALNTFVTSAGQHHDTFDILWRLTIAFFLFNSTTAESVTNHNEAELQRRCQERQLEIDHMEQVLETKIQLLQEVRPFRTSGGLKLARCKQSRLFLCVFALLGGPASTQRGREDGLAGWIAVTHLPPLLGHLNGGHTRWSEASQISVMFKQQQRQVGNSKLAVTSWTKPHCSTDRLSVLRLIEELTKKLQVKEAFITELSGAKKTLTLKVGELEMQVHELHSSLLQKDKDVEVYTVL